MSARSERAGEVGAVVGVRYSRLARLGDNMHNDNGAVTGSVKWIMRLEGLAVFGACLLIYHRLGLSWTTFAIFFLVPDLSMLGYIAGPRLGAVFYNAAHSYIGPLIFAVLAIVSQEQVASIVALIWLGHIGIDRALGFGLKYATSFKDTHLGRLGRPAAA